MRRRIRRQCYYDARVNDVNLEEITSSENNANILRALRGDQPIINMLVTTTLIDNDDAGRFSVGDGDDMGWLGYFIGRSESLEFLLIGSLPEEREEIEALIEGITRNKSIQKIGIITDHLGNAGPSILGDFFSSNKSLSGVAFAFNNIGDERAQDITSLISQMRHNSLTKFSLYNNTISDEGFSEICRELRKHSQLEDLSLKGSDIGRNGYVTLGSMLSSWHAPSLKDLNLGDTSIDDGGLQTLVEGMTNCSNLSALTLSGNQSITAAGLRSLSPFFQSGSCSLQYLKLEDNSIDDGGLHALVEGMTNCNNLSGLSLSGNRSITAAGLRSLSTLFQSENCSLGELRLDRMNIGDDGVTALVEGLRGNKSLRQLQFNVDSSEITEVGWSAFSNHLCDTSSIINTYLSNHTLEMIGDCSGTPPELKVNLGRNTLSNKHDAAIWKIIRHHREFDIETFFQWKLKFLPLVVTWFDRATPLISRCVSALKSQDPQPHAVIVTIQDSDDSFMEQRHNSSISYESKKLSVLYQFVRGMPMLVIDGYQSKTPLRRSKRRKLLNGG